MPRMPALCGREQLEKARKFRQEQVEWLLFVSARGWVR